MSKKRHKTKSLANEYKEYKDLETERKSLDDLNTWKIRKEYELMI